MEPALICNTILGNDRLGELVDKLSSPQIKAVLKEGGLKVKTAGGFVTQKKRRKTWSGKILASIAAGSDDTASEFLQQWLLHHERELLIDYLDALGVPHRVGETDESFLFTCPAERLREEASKLLVKHPADVVTSYIAYVAFQQKSHVFDEWEPLTRAARGTADPGAAPSSPEAPPNADD